MSDARSLVDEMQVIQAEHLPLVAAFPERMGLAAVATVSTDPGSRLIDVGEGHLRLQGLGHSEDGTAKLVLMTVRDAHGVRSEIFAADETTGVFG
ncbi:MAG TPA: hypothetical protein VFE20_01435 [Thermoleophilia bacterium]|nr:hypothetical protein [Thermoleophilia bacterium]